MESTKTVMSRVEDLEFGKNTMHQSMQSLDIESQSPMPKRKTVRRKTTRTSRLVSAEIREMVATAYKGEVQSMIRWRDVWKKAGDTCEAVAKGLTGVSAVFAFAASALRDPRLADIFSFTSGSIGTVGLVLLTYSSYATKESRQRTTELNNMLDSIGVTPLPDIALQEVESS
jgi:hypothetical protein